MGSNRAPQPAPAIYDRLHTGSRCGSRCRTAGTREVRSIINGNATGDNGFAESVAESYAQFIAEFAKIDTIEGLYEPWQ